MAKSGLLAQAFPAAAALLYRAPINATASAVLTAAADGTGGNYSVGIKDYDQEFTLDASTYLFHRGDVISNEIWTLDNQIDQTLIQWGNDITSTDGEKAAKFHSFVKPAATTIYVQTESLRRLTVESQSGEFAVGDTLTTGASPDDTTATIYEVYSSGANFIIVVGPSTVNGAGAEFTDADVVTATSGGTATISAGGVSTAFDSFIFSTTTAGGVYNSYYSDQLVLFDERNYVFDVSDASMTGRTFRLSDSINGEWGPDGVFGNGDDGTEYTLGKTVTGTPGNAGASVAYDFGLQAPPTPLYYYDAGTGTATNADYGGEDRFLTLTSSVTYNQIRVYDVVGTWVNNVDTFIAGNTTFIVTAKSGGKWGIVKESSGATLRVSLGLNSAAFVATDTFFDAPAGETLQALAEISSVDVDVTDIPSDAYIVNTKALSASAVDKISALVVGPGQSVVVESSAQHVSYNLVGFEDVSTEITPLVYTP